MKHSRRHQQQSRHLLLYLSQTGFTLLELLVVISLLGIITGLAVVSYQDVQDQGRYDAVQYEMAEIRNALLQFRRDSGTNDFPGQGTYDCTDASNGGSSTVVNSKFTTMPLEAGSTAAAKIAWCQHPANFWMLFQNPLTTSWNRDTKRGWNGPYLQRKSGYVDVGSIQNTGAGNPSSAPIISNLWGIASPFIYKPSSASLIWRTEAGNTSTNFSKQGTPYFIFDLNNADSNNPARLVSLGQDNDYDGADNSNCLPPKDTLGNSTDENGFPHDYVLCLLR